ncbi:hypothetical protein CFE70_010609 [Pyrenophora teres f. teres 0-1]|uniref:CFEM domain-containing protein n=2 Tax=Pyrenophora teres f. teres TaxID=97479 RepID=E3S6Z4_PYRTT|nr:hypothetical protein PTT_18558 [Pyrenophora teres f. teres 0-1]KAE8843346.1 hypothetical protein HRS9139_02643 [Pyrenophora teres f. teres]CAA9959263.1 CFEM domain containing protein [Pyrenophora teres f. maculata]KAE8849599.1 hypothetical protein PTNB85_00015 [Pyrenophora teres f. teres]KAE8852374.1 hypothetical protein HRS9122_02661 [Pyrenophora teres f. teres]
MKLSSSVFAIFTILPAVWTLPTNLLRESKLPTCGASQCLATTNGLFDGCAPGDLTCICTLEQSEVDRYVTTVQPCLDGEPGKKACTAGAVANYKQLLARVCKEPEYGSLNKNVTFAPAPAPVPAPVPATTPTPPTLTI